MSKHSIVFALLLCSLSLFAQSSISKAEYWIDNDAGYGKGTAIALAGNTAEANIPTSGLSEGWHLLGLRSYGGDSWSQTYLRSFYIYTPGASATSITGAEYWVDTDPGHGLAEAIPYTSSQSSFAFTVANTDALSYGLHVVGMRVKRGYSWSTTCTRAFMTLSPEEMANDITGAEYWIDDDPGYDNATAIPFTTHQTQFALNVPMDELSDGYHRIGLRVRYSNRWSQTYIREILNANFKPIMDVEKVEAYWDYDESNVFNVPFTVVDNHVEITGFPLSTADLSYGTHILSLRAVADDVPSVIMHYTVCKNATPLFVFSEEEACVNEELSIIDQSENVQANTTYAWDIDSNGKTDYTDKGNIVHTFTKAGTYTVTLTVQTGDGCESSYSKEIVVRAKTTPKVSLSRSKSSSCAGETVTFTATATNAGDNPTFTWLRNGNAIAGQTESVLEISDLADNDKIQVQVTSSDRCPSTPTASSSTYTQRVYALPEVSLTFPEAFYSDAGTITLAGHGTPTGGTYYVDDTQMSSVNMATVGIGEHTLRYVVKNSNKCTAEQSVTFTVSERPKYLITFVDDDGTTVIQQSEVALDAMPTPPADPTKEATAQYTYTFAGWDKEIVAVTADATYKATYNRSVNRYVVTFVDEDGTELGSDEYEYGDTPEPPADPSKPATAQYTYTFAGWSPEVTTVTENVTYKATYTSTVNKYKVTFVDEDGTTVLASDEYEYGATPTPPADPSKAETGEYTYTFAGWTPEIAAVTEAATYTATYTATHLVVPTELSLTSAGYNTTDNVVLCIKFTGDATVCNDIMLAGNYNSWSTSIAEMLKFTPLAGFDGWYAVEFPYVVTEDGFGNEIYPQGKPVELDNEGVFGWDNQCGDPDAWIHKGGNYAGIVWGIAYEADIIYYSAGAYIYEMTYWKKHINPCADIIRHDYTINLYAPDACEEMRPAVSGDFNNWNYGVPMTAQIDENQQTFYTVTINAKEGQGFKIREVNADDWVNQLQYKNEDGEWRDFDNLPLGADEVITLDWSDNEMYRYASCIPPATYTVTWLNDDGTLLESDANVMEGSLPEYNGETPTKDATAQYTYTFAGWTPAVVAVTADATYTATYSSTVNTFEITFVVKDNPTLTHTITDVPYGTTIGDLIELAIAAIGGDTFEDEMHIYTFAGVEDAELTDIITESRTYYILYTKTEKSPTSIIDAESATPVQKIIRDDKVFILRDSKIYTVQGVEVR